MTLQSIDTNIFLVNPKDFKDENKLDSGSYGKAVLCTQKKTDKKYVVKYIEFEDEKYKLSFKREVENLAKHIHPSIVPFIGYFEDEDEGRIYLEFIKNESLANYIKKNKSKKRSIFSYTEKYIICYGLALGMQYLHSNKCIHRDFKAANTLLDENLYPYITDFGSSKNILMLNNLSTSQPGISPKIMAPELIEEMNNGEQDYYQNTLPIDVYSYGITIFELWKEDEIYKDLPNSFKLFNKVLSGYREKIPDYVPNNWKKLIEKCWSKEPKNRPTFNEIVTKLRSSDYLTKDVNKNELKKYHEFLESKYRQLYEFRKKLILKKENPLLANLRPKESSNNIDKIYKYIITQSSRIFGKTDDYEVILFSQKFLKIIDEDKTNCRDKMKQIATVEMLLGKSFSSSGFYNNGENYLRRSINHGEFISAFYLAELMSFKLIKEKTKDEMIRLYEIASNNGVIEAQKKMPFIQFNKFLLKPKDGEKVMNYIYGMRKKYGIDTTQNYDEFITFMIKSSKENYGPAILEIALRLYQNNRKKDAAQFFKKAAEIDYPEGNFYYSIILKEKNDKNYLSYLKKAALNHVPDAIGEYGNFLIKNKKEKEGVDHLMRAALLGSMRAMISLGLFYKEKREKKESKYYFEKASECCHCINDLEIITPLKYKFYKCKDCNKVICQACANHCHSNHKIVEIGDTDNFKCECDSFDNKCTKCINRESYQHFYICLTCCKETNKCFICKNCIKKCHKNHEIQDCGIQRGICSCGKNLLPNYFKCKFTN